MSLQKNLKQSIDLRKTEHRDGLFRIAGDSRELEICLSGYTRGRTDLQ